MSSGEGKDSFWDSLGCALILLAFFGGISLLVWVVHLTHS